MTSLIWLFQRSHIYGRLWYVLQSMMSSIYIRRHLTHFDTKTFVSESWQVYLLLCFWLECYRGGAPGAESAVMYCGAPQNSNYNRNKEAVLFTGYSI